MKLSNLKRRVCSFFPALKIRPVFGAWGSVALLVACALIVTINHAEPAHALFFQQAETWLTGNFPQANGAIVLVGNALRALFVIYVAVSIVSVINKLRQDEDWQTAARTPIIVTVGITIMDVLTTAITA
ncbi:hypothetical protein [Anthocerotibacter panamensis]|uniref:hypothetical protein n=1 Tax=Anthocerotibacter panamensis TaxID=2857077 RepID=UPI001C406628|nr:hypothetical protein [Anthocerotibacter panamensis]